MFEIGRLIQALIYPLNMNFLAHLYLSGDDHEIMVGNFIADHVKGNAIHGFNDKIQMGIRFHREIDQFTDSNPYIKEAVVRLRPEYRKYAGVVMDMFCDHFLAANWKDWSQTDLKAFAANSYAVLMDHHDLLPERTRIMLPYMMRYDLLSNYARDEGIGFAFNGMSQRTTFVSNLEKAVVTLRADYDYYHQQFNRFFPQMISFAGEYLKIHS